MSEAIADISAEIRNYTQRLPPATCSSATAGTITAGTEAPCRRPLSLEAAQPRLKLKLSDDQKRTPLKMHAASCATSPPRQIPP